MADLPTGYRDVSPDEQAKAKKFFEHGKTVADTGNYDYAIDLYLMGLNVDPDAREGHEGLRNLSLIRKASGGKDLGFMEKAKLRRPGKDDKQTMLGAERLLAYDPGNTDSMVTLMQSALRGGYFDTVMWIGPILMRANSDSKSPDFHKYIALRDVYREVSQWKLATEACHYALRMKPLDMDLQAELKNLSALETMNSGNYESAGSFRDSIRDRGKQQDYLASERDVVGADFHARRVKECEAEWQSDPNEPGRLTKYVDALEATEELENENRAIEVLEEAYNRTKQFRFRLRAGKIKMTQMSRMERSFRQAMEADANDPQLQKDYDQFKQEQLEFELSEFTLAAEAYPTDLSFKYQVATRLFALNRFDEAIPAFQQARVDPKVRIDASVFLGRAFLESGYVDEAVETIQAVMDSYDVKGDERAKEMHYWQGRALEAQGNLEQALKRYSQVAQWEFTYRDVQTRIKALRAARKSS